MTHDSLMDCFILCFGFRYPTVWVKRLYETGADAIVRCFSITSRATYSLNSFKYFAVDMVSMLQILGRIESSSPTYQRTPEFRTCRVGLGLPYVDRLRLRTRCQSAHPHCQEAPSPFTRKWKTPPPPLELGPPRAGGAYRGSS